MRRITLSTYPIKATLLEEHGELQAMYIEIKGDSVRGDFANLGNLLRTSSTVAGLKISVSFGVECDISELISGIQANKSLEDVKVLDYGDRQIKNIISAITDHPTIASLFIRSTYETYEVLLALAHMISRAGCKTKSLTLSGFCEYRINIETLLSALIQNVSLTYLQLIECNLSTEEADDILSTLWRCPNIQKLKVLGTKNVSFFEFPQFLSQSKPSRLRHLDFGFQSRRVENRLKLSFSVERRERLCGWLFRMLETHLELWCFGTYIDGFIYLDDDFEEEDGIDITYSDDEEEYTRRAETEQRFTDEQRFLMKSDQVPKLRHLGDLNRTGRVLIGNEKIPLSVWSRVLERANEALVGQSARQANAIFHLVRGSPFLWSRKRTPVD
jgi:hypothetical protein